MLHFSHFTLFSLNLNRTFPSTCPSSFLSISLPPTFPFSPALCYSHISLSFCPSLSLSLSSPLPQLYPSLYLATFLCFSSISNKFTTLWFQNISQLYLNVHKIVFTIILLVFSVCDLFIASASGNILLKIFFFGNSYVFQLFFFSSSSVSFGLQLPISSGVCTFWPQVSEIFPLFRTSFLISSIIYLMATNLYSSNGLHCYIVYTYVHRYIVLIEYI